MPRRWIAAAFLLLTLPATGWCVRHIDPDAYPQAAHDKIGRPPLKALRKFGSPRAALVGGASGHKNVAVLVVEFPKSSLANPPTSGSNTIQSFANINTYFSQMTTYYLENSYGELTLHFNFFTGGTSALNANGDAVAAGPALLMPRPMEYYGCGDEGVGCTSVTTPSFGTPGAHGNVLVRDALNLLNTKMLLNAPKSRSAGGAFDALILIHAGNGNETTSANGDIWSIFYSDDTVIGSAGSGSNGFSQAFVGPETESDRITSPLGVMCHEFGHELGLPDLYNTAAIGGTSVVGAWDLMDYGPFLDNGENPAHLGAWCKYNLGWAQPDVVTSTKTVSIGFSGLTRTAMLRLPVQNGLPNEYFLVEQRTKVVPGLVFDRHIPASGILIWHIDDDITSSRGVNAANPSVANTVNTGYPHYGVSLVTADGSPAGSGQAENVFLTGDFTSPQSDNFNGQPSGISLVEFRNVGTAMASFQVINLAVTASQIVLKLINYPNPAGPGREWGNGTQRLDGHTAIQAQLGRPARDIQMNIYTLSGDLVRKVDRSEIHVQADRSLDQKWVYEFLWDLKNGDGQHVAAGVYLYFVRADGESKSAKLVVVR